jgi:hypothetical protein
VIDAVIKYMVIMYGLDILCCSLLADVLMCKMFQIDHQGKEGILEKSYGEMVTGMGNSDIR